ncbi:hypothetical protein FPHYL_9483 [Fusarium phyllophilum]|uniref:Uncharacterized protein n=1 Tax=Fusarium phyllophilum TaxID=47803 RepID=A0A8H5J723_9HYPO|nr:hypothetical protein FPHYL_9483 [Fusarium phyllophilum]
MAINPFLNKDEMTSRRSSRIPPLSSSAPEFTQSSVLLSSQSRFTEKKLHSKKRRSQDDPTSGIAASRPRRLADIPRRVERIKEADAWPRDEIPRTPGPYQLPDWDQCSNRAQVSSPGLEPEYELYQTAPLEPYGVSLEAAIDNWRGSWRPSHLAHDGGFAYAGSWCYSAPVEPSHLELEWHNPERVVLTDDWRPETPRDTRLSTPDLPPLSTDFEFCPCHHSGEHEQDRINQEFYLATRSKMDVQMINALAHIAQDQTASGSEFRQVSREMKDA